MKKLILLSVVAACCFGQGKQNVVQTGVVDARGAMWLLPTSTFASPPSPSTGAVYVFTDAAGTCAGTGSGLALCRWNGSAWEVLGGATGGSSSPRVVTLTDAATVTLNADSTDVGVLTSLSQGTTFANPTGTPVSEQTIELRVKSSSSRALTWGAQ